MENGLWAGFWALIDPHVLAHRGCCINNMHPDQYTYVPTASASWSDQSAADLDRCVALVVESHVIDTFASAPRRSAGVPFVATCRLFDPVAENTNVAPLQLSGGVIDKLLYCTICYCSQTRNHYKASTQTQHTLTQHLSSCSETHSELRALSPLRPQWPLGR